jgi:hypothetical protein
MPSSGMWRHVDIVGTLKLETTRSSETSVHTRSKWRHIPEDGILYSHRRENLKSYIDRSSLKSRILRRTIEPKRQ